MGDRKIMHNAQRVMSMLYEWFMTTEKLLPILHLDVRKNMLHNAQCGRGLWKFEIVISKNFDLATSGASAVAQGSICHKFQVSGTTLSSFICKNVKFLGLKAGANIFPFEKIRSVNPKNRSVDHIRRVLSTRGKSLLEFWLPLFFPTDSHP